MLTKFSFMHALKKNILLHVQTLAISNNYPFFHSSISSLIVSLFFPAILSFVSISVVLHKLTKFAHFFSHSSTEGTLMVISISRSFFRLCQPSET